MEWLIKELNADMDVGGRAMQGAYCQGMDEPEQRSPRIPHHRFNLISLITLRLSNSTRSTKPWII